MLPSNVGQQAQSNAANFGTQGQAWPNAGQRFGLLPNMWGANSPASLPAQILSQGTISKQSQQYSITRPCGAQPNGLMPGDFAFQLSATPRDFDKGGNLMLNASVMVPSAMEVVCMPQTVNSVLLDRQLTALHEAGTYNERLGKPFDASKLPAPEELLKNISFIGTVQLENGRTGKPTQEKQGGPSTGYLGSVDQTVNMVLNVQGSTTTYRMTANKPRGGQCIYAVIEPTKIVAGEEFVLPTLEVITKNKAYTNFAPFTKCPVPIKETGKYMYLYQMTFTTMPGIQVDTYDYKRGLAEKDPNLDVPWPISYCKIAHVEIETIDARDIIARRVWDQRKMMRDVPYQRRMVSEDIPVDKLHIVSEHWYFQ